MKKRRRTISTTWTADELGTSRCRCRLDRKSKTRFDSWLRLNLDPKEYAKLKGKHDAGGSG